ncbi:MAG: adenylate/guanylate cyclase domain-containing protein [Burkholderiaceae bacterium]|nr:adenylate/guanylate cyclase domain-containing protein [Burkholderiaceae bacterium]
MVVIALLLGLPFAAWMDMRDLTERLLSRQAHDLDTTMSSILAYYANNVTGRILAAHGEHIEVIHNYEAIPGAVPIPATLSLEMGRVLSERKLNLGYRFVSDYPFKSRAPHMLDDFEKNALLALRANPRQQISDMRTEGLTSQVRVITPVIMSAACVQCHNHHPESPKTDWKVGDVRGIQEISVSQPIVTTLFSFTWLLAYFTALLVAGTGFFWLQRRQTRSLLMLNNKLEETNTFLAVVSEKISRYLSPQIYKSIFSGERDVKVHTERKKLTIFFSDIKDFTATTESTQPEQLTSLLNEYLTAMSAIALGHGGTIDKFIGDAILVFFGDPETRGEAEDARACLRMAFDMQERLAELNAKWLKAGVAQPFRVRMGINTGYCNVGNFGSEQRLDYTIIGGEANLAARLQSIAEAGEIVMSYETWALVSEMVNAAALPPIHVKGISRDIIPYRVIGRVDASGVMQPIMNEHARGFTLFLDLASADSEAVAQARRALQVASDSLDKANGR